PELVRHLRQRLAVDVDGTPPFAQYEVDLAPLRVSTRVVVSRMPAPALLALQRSPRHALGHGQHRLQVERRMPARVVATTASLNRHVPGPLLQPVDRLPRQLELCASR